MDICFIGTDIGPSVHGTFVRGHVNNVVRLSKTLANMGHNINIITNKPSFSDDASYEKWMPYAQISYFSTMFPSLKENGPEFVIKTLSKVVLDRGKKPFDIVNVHSGFPVLATLSAISRHFTKAKTVHTLYSPFDYALNNSILDRLFLSRLSLFSFSSLDKVIAVSENVKRSLLSRHVAEDRIVVIPPVISEDFFNPQLSAQDICTQLEIDNLAPVVAYMGGLEGSKGLAVLLKIIPKVVTRIPEVVFVIALNRSADDPRLKAFEMDLQKSSFAKSIRVVGITDKIADILRMADVFVAPYLHTMGVADYPLAIFEAMAVGKVVIAFDVGGIPEMLSQERGIIIRAGDICSFVEEIVRVIRNKDELDIMAKSAARFAIQNYSVENVAVKTIELFTDLVEN